MIRTRCRVPLFLLALLSVPAGIRAQQCDAQVSCRLGVRSAEATLAGTMLSAGGGNPWAGSPSTLGFRTVTFPRIAVQARVGYTSFDVHDRGTSLEDASAFSLTGGFSMALLDGFSPGSTVGGTGSVDVYGSAGVLFLPGDAGFESTAPFTWSIGARIGIFRESFTLPGITASVAYRGVGDVTFDRAVVLERESGFEWNGASAWQVRGVVGKRVAGLGLSGGVGWDTGSAETTVTFRRPTGTATEVVDIEPSRWQAFGGLSWTSLIFSLAAEAGWQFGTDPVTALEDRDPAAAGHVFGTLAARVTF